MESAKFSNKLFYPHMFKMMVKRYWPFWIVLLLCWFFLLPFSLYTRLSGQSAADIASGFYVKEAIYVITEFATVPVFLSSIFVAMAVFYYMMNKDQTQFMHSLPVTKTGLFITNYLTGLIVMVSSYLFAALLGALACRLCASPVDMPAFGMFLYATVMQTVFFYSLAVFCIMITGQLIAAPIFYGILNFAAVVFGFMIYSLMSFYMYGYSGYSGIMSVTEVLSPVFALTGSFNCGIDYETGKVIITGMHLPAVYAAIGILIAAISFFMYKKRKNETAGATLVFGFTKPIFKYCVMLYLGLGLGEIITDISASDTGYRNVGIMLPQNIIYFFAIVFGILGYYAAEMLMKKTTRVFKGSLKGLIPGVAVIAAIIAVFNFDIIGYESYVPSAEDVQSVSVDIGANNYTEISEADSKEVINAVLALHSYLTENAKEVSDMSYNAAKNTGDTQMGVYTNTVTINYTLTNGKNKSRSYDILYYGEDFLKEDNALEALREFLKDESVAEAAFDSIFTNDRLTGGYLFKASDDGSMQTVALLGKSSEELEELYNAVRKDYINNLYEYAYINTLSDYLIMGAGDYAEDVSYYDMALQVYDTNYNAWDSTYYEGSYNESFELQLTSSWTNTIAALKDIGVLTDDDIKTTDSYEGYWSYESSYYDSEYYE